MSNMTDRERHLIQEAIKAFIGNRWALTPEGVWGFFQDHGEPIDKSKIECVLAEQQEEGIQR